MEGQVGSPNGWEEGIYEAVEEAVSNLLQCSHLEQVWEPHWISEVSPLLA